MQSVSSLAPLAGRGRDRCGARSRPQNWRCGHAFAAGISAASSSFASRLSIDMDGVLQTLLSELENRPSPRPSPRTSGAREIVACRGQVGARAPRIGAAVRRAQRGSEESMTTSALPASGVGVRSGNSTARNRGLWPAPRRRRRAARQAETGCRRVPAAPRVGAGAPRHIGLLLFTQ